MQEGEEQMSFNLTGKRGEPGSESEEVRTEIEELGSFEVGVLSVELRSINKYRDGEGTASVLVEAKLIGRNCWRKIKAFPNYDKRGKYIGIKYVEGEAGSDLGRAPDYDKELSLTNEEEKIIEERIAERIYEWLDSRERNQLPLFNPGNE